MKVNFSKNNKKRSKAALIALVVLIFAVIGSGIFLNTRNIFHAENPLKSINENRSHILVSGEKYTMNSDQEQEYVEQEQKREEIRIENQQKIEAETGIVDEIEPPKEEEKSDEEKPQEESKPENTDDSNAGLGENNSNEESEKPGNTDGESGSGSQSGGNGGGNGSGGAGTGGSGGNVDEGKDPSKMPKIECTLRNGQQVTGNYLSFDVRAKSYKKVIISSFNMHVTVNGTKVTSSGTSSSGWITYKDDGFLVDGANTIRIKATDAEGNSASVSYIVQVDANAERPVEGTCTVTVDAPSIGLGTLFTRQVTIYEGENVSAVMLRAFDGSGFRATFTGSVNHGFYLNRVYKPGLTAGWNLDMIHPNVKKHLLDMNASFMGMPPLDSLGEFDIYGGSGWVVSYNGWYGDGMALVPCNDGDELRLSFTVELGNEYNGKWEDCYL